MQRAMVSTVGAVALVLLAGQGSGAGAEGLVAHKVTSQVTVFEAGGNVTALVTHDGLLVVDSGVSENAPKLVEALEALSPRPVRFLINTHHHFDHVGGNATVGAGATIVAHALAKAPDADKGPATETFTDEKTVKVAGEAVRLLHFGPGHTAGDTVVVMESQKVIAAGDLFFNGVPPYIDVAAGADTENWIQTIEALAERYPDYHVVPGHGAVTDMAHFRAFATYLEALRTQVAAAIAAGQTREEAQESVTLAEFGDLKEFGSLTRKNNVGWVYDELTKK